jgi:DNA-binding CsgD family transcriptional regulator/ArsR family metal-binding transcriptional regulator
MGERCWFAHFRVDGDFSGLFPFIQSTVHEAAYFESPEHIQFRLEDIVCALYPPDIVAARYFYGREQSLEFVQRLLDFLNELERSKSQLKPSFKKLSRIHVPELLYFLPNTNCGECGYRTCMAFAGAVSRRKTKLIACRHFPKPIDAKICFAAQDQKTEMIRTIEVDPELAGVMITRIDDAQVPQQRLDSKQGSGSSTGITGNRDGIIFKITAREAEVLRLLTEGFTNKEIAEILKVSHNTVKSHVVHIFDKLGVNDRTQAAVWAAQNELV